MELNLKGRLAIVTGNSKGIGLAISEALREEGVRVADVSRTNGYNLMEDGVDKVIEMFRSYPHFDILVNNVGGMGNCREEDWEECMKKNYGIMVRMTHNFLKQEKDWGRVITISSIYGKEKGINPYFTASKASQIAYMKSMAGTVKGTTFNTICPGEIDVGKVKREDHFGNPEDVANLVTFLCSPLASYINGATITVDGGYSHSF